MQLKKTLSLAITGSILSTLAYAGSADQNSNELMPAAQSSYVYIQGNVGYASTSWENGLVSNTTTNWSNGNGGFTWGVDAGYMWTKNLGLELGYFMFPSASWTGSGLTTDLDQWAFYGAAKLALPICNNIDLYTKIGVNYNRGKFSQPSSSITSHKWGLLAGAGLDYTFSNNVFIEAQYLYFQGDYGNGNSSPLPVSGVSTYTAGVGYKFSV